MNDNPTWDKDAHLTKPSLFNYKACFDEGDFDEEEEDDDDSSSEDEAEDSPDQDMHYESGFWAYIDTVAHAFFVSFLAIDKRTGEYHPCQARVVHYFFLPPNMKDSSVSSFTRLPPQGHIEASKLDDRDCQHTSLGPLRNHPSGSTQQDRLSMVSASIREAISLFQRTTVSVTIHIQDINFSAVAPMTELGIDLKFQRFQSVKIRKKWGKAKALYFYFYITFVAKAMDDTFYCDTKVRRCTQAYKVLSFSRRSEDGIYQEDKPYVDLDKPESLSLITEYRNPNTMSDGIAQYLRLALRLVFIDIYTISMVS
ncbi:hypothetical protein Tsubulata_016991 [Turnera subulata]|uniref:Uncharacterized protein n=1 Tax=Turnera subulata TaxID=218843 RepID=A0A9Q0JIX2_9ROSI|nr:hypothetical protein Tsubulata_016991 [Turnera subulata]